MQEKHDITEALPTLIRRVETSPVFYGDLLPALSYLTRPEPFEIWLLDDPSNPKLKAAPRSENGEYDGDKIHPSFAVSYGNPAQPSWLVVISVGLDRLEYFQSDSAKDALDWRQ